MVLIEKRAKHKDAKNIDADKKTDKQYTKHT